jgi:RHS repeat-associated protein
MVQKGYDGWASPVNEDRLGSVEYDGTNAPKYFPYGDEATATQQNRRKFATYYRDSTTALDYAQQRYYASTLGRFTSPDLSGLGAVGSDPQSWNRYTYVENDPVNFNDPTGEIKWIGASPDEDRVFVLPIVFIVNVFRSIFGGGPKDPAILWKLSAATEVKKWDQKIADAIKKGEEDEQKRRYVKELKVIDDCYQTRAVTNSQVRRFRYQPIDQYGESFARGEVRIDEQNYLVQGNPKDLVGGAAWGSRRQEADGSFYDYVGKAWNFFADLVEYQTFTATITRAGGFAAGLSMPVMVYYPGYGDEFFGTWGHWIMSAGVRTNGYFFSPETGRKICDDPVYPY